jgi:hypothetical protein
MAEEGTQTRRDEIAQAMMAQQEAVDPWSQLPPSGNVEQGATPSWGTPQGFQIPWRDRFGPSYMPDYGELSGLGAEMGNQDIYNQMQQNIYNQGLNNLIAGDKPPFFDPSLNAGSLSNDPYSNPSLIVPQQGWGVEQLEGDQSFFGGDPYADYASLNPVQQGNATTSQVGQGFQQNYIDPYYEGTTITPATSTNPDDFIMPDPPWNLKDIAPDADPTQFQGVDQNNQLAGYFEGSSPYGDAGAYGIPSSYGAPGGWGRHRREGL